MSDAQTLFQQALRVHQNGNLTEAETLYEQILAHEGKSSALDPIIITTHFNLGMLFLKQGKQDAALQQFSTVLKRHPSSILAHLQLANLYLLQNKLDDAIQHYKAVLQYQPQQIEALNNLGVAFLKQANPRSAIEYFTKALQTDPQHKDARNNLAATLLQQDEFKDAIWHYQLLLQLAPDDSEAHYNLGVAHMMVGDLAAATEQFEKTLILTPNRVDAYCNLGAICLKKANKEQAIAYYQQAATLAPNNAAIQYRLAALTGQNTPLVAPTDYIKNLFDNYASHFDQQVTTQLHYQLPSLLHQILANYILVDKQYRTLDLGCGTGLTGSALRNIASHLTGVDISTRMLAKAREKNIYDQLIETDITQFITTATDQYDLIIAADTFVYFGDLNTIFSNIQKLLPLSGIFVFSTELGANTSFQLQSTGRYTHSKSYIEQLASQYEFSLLDYQEITSREQEGRPVISSIFILKSIREK